MQDLEWLARAIGHGLSQLHAANIMHGDLTTSNLMLPFVPAVAAGAVAADGTTITLPALTSDADIDQAGLSFIDFGLSFFSLTEEDAAVDLYVLERALTSTHPASEDFFRRIIHYYEQGPTENEAFAKSAPRWPARVKLILKRLSLVQVRGRKRSMLG
ncbi:hypothetical protein H696_03390 [Fonticula alba]|uniref:non-specific serine/threonine protein kinase n=1 Tax=Fonticula alba TaxID=691883 RepID=A0A058Z6P2_FONAL|nr:hypothetical protein H696_03390 [Fonticula alba]KCV69925.1 hypothetical protein H696_03390 [Fonticula alba]|eukprot:XP_009495531.1 hypothetical protein H696_03390 [Fonticula alba]